MVLDNHDRVPDAHDIPLVIRVLLEHTQIKPCEVWMPGRQGRAPEKQNTIRLYMPSPSLNNDEMKAFKEHLTAPTFSFLVDCRGRATPFQPSRGGRPRPMECTECLGLDHYKDNCPITTAPEFLAVHLNDAEQNSVRVGTTLGSITAHNDVTPPDAFKTVSYRTPRGDRGGSRNYRGGRLRGRGRGRGRDF
ncbi:hypothetical protein K438DRAFT_272906 [Mycena galopus ATCC 62051]|nr:hypothetical protein K438DRAFT_272906 [Mycena galopus ATCC 62051]